MTVKVNERFIVELQGKKFVTYEGLLDTAHQLGLIKIETELVKSEENQAIFKATAKTEDKTFTGYGDADSTNVNKLIGKHLIRMAETRAKARALRDLTNIGMTAIEELGAEDMQNQNNDQDKKGKDNKKPPNRVTENQLKKIYALVNNIPDLTVEEAKEQLGQNYGVESSKELTKEQASDYIKYLEELEGK